MQVKIKESATLFTPSEIGPEIYEATCEGTQIVHDSIILGDIGDVYSIPMVQIGTSAYTIIYIRIWVDKLVNINLNNGNIIPCSHYFCLHNASGDDISSITITSTVATTQVNIVALR